MNNLFTGAAEILQPFFWLDFAGKNGLSIFLENKAAQKPIEILPATNSIH